MVDKALFIGNSGAKDSMHQLEMVSNNLANANTTGFRADYEVAKQFQDNTKGPQSRSYSIVDTSYTDFKTGPVNRTERDLDIALSGDGFIAVQSKSGAEGYTRAGDLQIKDGLLMTSSGNLVLGTSGIINVANADRISIANDGAVSVRYKGDPTFVQVNRIKLTNPAVSQLQKGQDGLFYLADGGTAKLDDKIRIIPGALEGSNVNTVQALTDLIELSRHFEFHTSLMKTVQDNSGLANKLLEL